MKCIKIIATSSIKRIKDSEASKLVASGQAEYVTKTAWRAADPEYIKRKPRVVKIEEPVET